MARRERDGKSRAAEFVKVYRFMTEGMGLTGTSLLVYARIFGFCKDTGGSFWESRRGTAEFLGISERQVTKRYEVTEEPVKRALRTVAKRHDPSLFDP